eukprot:1163491-Prymnesium_polylepis.1
MVPSDQVPGNLKTSGRPHSRQVTSCATRCHSVPLGNLNTPRLAASASCPASMRPRLLQR